MSSPESGPPATDPIAAALADFVDRREIPGIVAAVTDVDRIVYTCALGLASGRNGSAMAADTIFRIASMTKLITSIGVMLLVDDGSIELDAAAADYLPDYRQPEVLILFDAATGEYRTRPANSDMTIRQLLSHTSGLGYWFLDARLYQIIGKQPDPLKTPFLLADPGTQFDYGVSTDLLGLVVEQVSGARLSAI